MTERAAGSADHMASGLPENHSRPRRVAYAQYLEPVTVSLAQLLENKRQGGSAYSDDRLVRAANGMGFGNPRCGGGSSADILGPFFRPLQV